MPELGILPRNTINVPVFNPLTGIVDRTVPTLVPDTSAASRVAGSSAMMGAVTDTIKELPNAIIGGYMKGRELRNKQEGQRIQAQLLDAQPLTTAQRGALEGVSLASDGAPSYTAPRVIDPQTAALQQLRMDALLRAEKAAQPRPNPLYQAPGQPSGPQVEIAMPGTVAVEPAAVTDWTIGMPEATAGAMGANTGYAASGTPQPGTIGAEVGKSIADEATSFITPDTSIASAPQEASLLPPADFEPLTRAQGQSLNPDMVVAPPDSSAMNWAEAFSPPTAGPLRPAAAVAKEFPTIPGSSIISEREDGTFLKMPNGETHFAPRIIGPKDPQTILIAKAPTSGSESKRETQIVPQQQADGSVLNVLVDKNTGEIIKEINTRPTSRGNTQKPTAVVNQRVIDGINAVDGLNQVLIERQAKKDIGPTERAALVKQSRPSEGVFDSFVRQAAQAYTSKDALELETLRNRVNSMIIFARGGSALTDSEKQALTVVEPDDAKDAAITKIKTAIPILKRELSTYSSQYPGQFPALDKLLQEPKSQSNIPDAAASHLRSNPSLAAAFDQKYGAGASTAVLGK